MALGVRLHDLRWLPSARESALVGHLGPDVLAPDFNPSDAGERIAAQRDRPLGEALLDQRVLAGVGNLYQTEVCFLLGRAPWTPASDVDPVAVARYCRELMERNLHRTGQATTPGGLRGDEHWVYRRRTCRHCGGTVRRGTLAAAEQDRTTYYCPRCQCS